MEEALPLLMRHGVCVIRAGEVPTLMIPQRMQGLGLNTARLLPANGDIRALHGKGEQEYWIFVNEGRDPWTGVIDVPSVGSCYHYDAWRDGWQHAAAQPTADGTRLSITLLPLHSTVVIFSKQAPAMPSLLEAFEGQTIRLDQGWTRSICRAIDYPHFAEPEMTMLPDDLAEEKPDFSGFARYEREISLERVPLWVALTITDAYEGVELFVNDVSLGIQIAPPFQYEVTPYLKRGGNRIVIEVATTLERENASLPDQMRTYLQLGPKQPTCPSGISGHVCWKQKEG